MNIKENVLGVSICTGLLTIGIVAVVLSLGLLNGDLDIVKNNFIDTLKMLI